MQPGFLSLAIHDSCLASLPPVAAHVRVSDVLEVEVDLSEKVLQPWGSPAGPKLLLWAALPTQRRQYHERRLSSSHPEPGRVCELLPSLPPSSSLSMQAEVGRRVTATVRVLGFQRLPLQSKYFKYMKLQLQAASPIVSLV